MLLPYDPERVAQHVRGQIEQGPILRNWLRFQVALFRAFAPTLYRRPQVRAPLTVAFFVSIAACAAGWLLLLAEGATALLGLL